MLKLTYFTLIVAVIFTIAVAAPIQELAPKPGHVPVYIREGNTPLSEINPKLVEAFPDDESVRSQIETEPKQEAVETAKEDNKDAIEDNANEDEKTDETLKAVDAKVEEVTASDIAEFDDVKSDRYDIEPAKVENPLEKKN